MTESKKNEKRWVFFVKRILTIVLKSSFIFGLMSLYMLFIRFFVPPLLNKLVFVSSDPIDPNADINLVKLTFAGWCVFCYLLRKWLAKPLL